MNTIKSISGFHIHSSREHIERCRTRALQSIKTGGEPDKTLQEFIADLNRHPGTETILKHRVEPIEPPSSDRDAVREWIETFHQPAGDS